MVLAADAISPAEASPETPVNSESLASLPGRWRWLKTVKSVNSWLGTLGQPALQTTVRKSSSPCHMARNIVLFPAGGSDSTIGKDFETSRSTPPPRPLTLALSFMGRGENWESTAVFFFPSPRWGEGGRRPGEGAFSRAIAPVSPPVRGGVEREASKN